MVDLNDYTSVAGLAILVGLLVQLIKPKLHAGDVPYVAVLIGIASALVVGIAAGSVVSLVSAVSWVIGGLLAGLSATGLYEVTLDKMRRKAR